ncbi:FAD-dependent oxidoreductase [Flexivirga oryzae]|uniref:Glycine/D-amino acid oxidase-like deaminating enzyme n=1 Tax=Flexivirga oryzae TaxID=1794944 RepID=A0A839NGG7_9MICO|nr:glycine/D-amino acid oxidase-like deaminating enzyme [Flexivirga oryzae]
MHVVIVGAGIVGAACARRLVADGHDVTIVDRAGTAGGTSASGEGNLLLSDKGPGPELQLAQLSARMWSRTPAALAEEIGHDPAIEYDAKGGLVVALTDEGGHTLAEFASGQTAAGVDARRISPDEARSLEPWLTEQVAGAVHYPQDAQVQPVAATLAFLESAGRRGARILQGQEVLGALLDASGGLRGVRTSHGELRADRVLIAAGPWSATVAERFGVHLPVLPRRGMVLVTSRMPHRVFHKVYDADYVGAVASGDAELQVSSVLESTAAGTVLIGSSRQRVGFDDTLQVDVLRRIAARAIRLFPFLADVPMMRAYGGFRPYMPDHLPVIGPDPRLPGLWHATGHEGAGIGLSLGTAELVADLMAGRECAIDPTPFAVDRPSLRAHLETEAAS